MPLSAEPGRSSASRLLAVLGAFEGVHRPLSLAQIARRSGLATATAFRMVRELVDWGAVERTDDGRFQVGLRLWRVGELAPRRRDVSIAARQVLLGLRDATRATSQLAVLDGTDVVIVDRHAGRTALPDRSEIAARLPAHATAVGKVFLAFSDTGLLSKVVAQGLASFTPWTITSPDRLARELELVRRGRLAEVRDELSVGTSSVAAPIFDADGALVAAIGLLTSSGDLRPLSRHVRGGAEAIAHRLHQNASEPDARFSQRKSAWSASAPGARVVS